jgi:hypothetical protein
MIHQIYQGRLEATTQLTTLVLRRSSSVLIGSHFPTGLDLDGWKVL